MAPMQAALSEVASTTECVLDPALDSLLPLAATLHATPGSHALLLGAGVSVAAGVPSAWDVEQELVQRVAALRGVEDVGLEPHAWYQQTFGEPATYQSLIEQAAPTSFERQRLLAGFFEPDSEVDDPAANRGPTAAHRAVARLVAGGSVRVVVTLNFDRLVERALREAGIEPVVVASADDVAGLPPVHTLRVLVVHLHGDYLTARTMKNTNAELAAYDDVVVSFMERLLHDHALVLVGWSAKYDPALRDLLSRAMRQYFTSYWVEPGSLSAVAEDLSARQRIVTVHATADAALGGLADAVTALRERESRHPLSTPVAVATAKRGLSGGTTAIGVHDLLRSELAALGQHALLSVSPQLEPNGGIGAARERLREAATTAAALTAAVAYWGDEGTDAWWFDEVLRFAHQRSGGGLVSVLELPRECGRLLYCAAGLAAVAAGRYHLLRRLLGATTTDLHGKPLELLDALGPGPSTWSDVRRAVADLSLGDRAVERSWEVFEVLRLAHHAETSAWAVEAATALDTATLRLRRAQADLSEAEGGRDLDAHDDAEEALRQARGQLNAVITRVGGQSAHPLPHLRVVDGFGSELPGHVPVVGRELLIEVERTGDQHPLVRAGFGSGSWAMLSRLLRLVCAQTATSGTSVAHRSLGPRGGAVPSQFWLDTLEPLEW